MATSKPNFKNKFIFIFVNSTKLYLEKEAFPPFLCNIIRGQDILLN